MANSSAAAGSTRNGQRHTASRRRPPGRTGGTRTSAPVATAIAPPPEIPGAARSALVGVLLVTPFVLIVAGALIAGLVLVGAGIVIAALGLVLAAGDLAFGRPERLAARLRTRPADPVADARLINLVDGLCVAAGVSTPALGVLEDPAANALLLATRHGALLVCTTGLLERLDRMELEAVLAHELSHLKWGDASGAGLASLACGALLPFLPASARLVARLSGDEREALADVAGARLTRYPPALAAAIEALAAGPVRPRQLDAVVLRATAGWWFAPLAEAEPAHTVAGRLDLGLRAAALGEL